MPVILQGKWKIEVKSKNAAYKQRYKIRNSTNANGEYEGETKTTPVYAHGKMWSISIDHMPTKTKKWYPSHERITKLKQENGQQEFEIETNDSHKDEDYDDLILTVSSKIDKENKVIGVIEKGRHDFKQLLVANPNYFGTVSDSSIIAEFEPVEIIPHKTKYEELTCIGFNPKLDALEAVVEVRLPYGYGGNLCTDGTREYVRFWIDYGDGWQNAGLVAINVHNIPDSKDCAEDKDKPLTYVASLDLKPKRDNCNKPVLPKVRGILAWEQIPEDDDPDWVMVWGNMLEANIQIKPHSYPMIEFDVLPPYIDKIKYEQFKKIPTAPLTTLELFKKYKTPTRVSLVEPSRFGFPEINKYMLSSKIGAKLIQAKVEEWAAVGLDWVETVGEVTSLEGNTTFEELKCLGLDNNRDWLVSTFTVKKQNGYLGDLCSDGSKEYIAFWADWEDKCQWQYLGTVTVDVYDINEIPDEGLQYAAIMHADLEKYRKSCDKQKVSRLRAVLSWNTPPSIKDPDKVPYWGNIIDTHVQIKPGEPMLDEAHLTTIGGIGVAHINVSGNGKTMPFAVFANDGTDADPYVESRECPFGGRIIVTGPPVIGKYYIVKVREYNNPLTETVLTSPITVTNEYGVSTQYNPDPSNGKFKYLAYSENMSNNLAYWKTTDNGLNQIKIELHDATYKIGESTWYNVLLDNVSPEAQIEMDGGECNLISKGTVITGSFIARDTHFGHFVLDTLPNSLNPPNPTTTTPATQETSPSGDMWKLDTSNMKPCGYVIQLRVYDRTIRDSVKGHHNHKFDDLGFCLIKK